MENLPRDPPLGTVVSLGRGELAVRDHLCNAVNRFCVWWKVGKDDIRIDLLWGREDNVFIVRFFPFITDVLFCKSIRLYTVRNKISSFLYTY